MKVWTVIVNNSMTNLLHSYSFTFDNEQAAKEMENKLEDIFNSIHIVESTVLDKAIPDEILVHILNSNHNTLFITY